MTDTGVPGHDRHQLAHAARAVARRRLLDIDPSGVRDDVEAAAQCECSCHPRPGEHVHPDEVCPCQLTEDERVAQLAEAEHALALMHEQSAHASLERATVLARVAHDLGVHAQEVNPASPWVVTGTVDGRSFYMSERWDAYSIVIAPDDEPGLDVWQDAQQPGITVREGTVDDLAVPGGVTDYRVALPFVVAEVRSELRRRTCPHTSSPGHRFCPRCGVPLATPADRTGSEWTRSGPGAAGALDSFIEGIDPATMWSGARLSTMAEAWARFKDADESLVASVAAARQAEDSWELIAVVLELGVDETLDRFARKVGG